MFVDILEVFLSDTFALQVIVPLSFSYDWQYRFYFVDVIQLIYEDQIERLKEKDLKEAKKRQRLGDNFLDLLYSIKVLIASVFATQLIAYIKIVLLYVAKKRMFITSRLYFLPGLQAELYVPKNIQLETFFGYKSTTFCGI